MTHEDDTLRQILEAAQSTEEARALEAAWTGLDRLDAETADAPDAGLRGRVEALQRGFALGCERSEQESGVLGRGSRPAWLAACAATLLAVLLGLQWRSSDSLAQSWEALAVDRGRASAMALLAHRNASERLRGLGLLLELQLSDEELRARLLDVRLHDPHASVRIAATRLLQDRRLAIHDGLDSAGLLASARGPLEELATIDLLLASGSREALPELRRLAESPATESLVRAAAVQAAVYLSSSKGDPS